MKSIIIQNTFPLLGTPKLEKLLEDEYQLKETESKIKYLIKKLK